MEQMTKFMKKKYLLTLLSLFSLSLTSCNQRIINKEFNLTKFDYDNILRVDYDVKINYVYLKLYNLENSKHDYMIVADIDKNINKNDDIEVSFLSTICINDYYFYYNPIICPLPLVYTEDYVYTLKEAVYDVMTKLEDYLESIYNQFNDNFREIHEEYGIYL